MSLSKFPLDLVVQTPGHLPGIVYGPPGHGKTHYIYNLFRWLDAPLVTIIGAIREPSDFGGIPCPTENGMRMAAPEWAKLINRDAKDKPLGGVFFSELTCSPPAIQAAMLRVMHEGWVGEEKLLPQVVRIADANPPDQAANGWELALPLANRMTHLSWPTPEASEWAEGFVSGWEDQTFTRVDPERWWEEYPRARAFVAAFLKSPNGSGYLWEDMSKPENQSRFPQAFATPRTVENAARLLATVFVTGRSDAQHSLLKASCGEAWSLAFSTWLEEAKLPDPEAVLADPDSWKPDPLRQDVTYAVLTSVALASLRDHKAKEERWLRAWGVLDKVMQQSGKGAVVVAARMLANTDKCPKVTRIPPAVSKVINDLHEVSAAAGVYDARKR